MAADSDPDDLLPWQAPTRPRRPAAPLVPPESPAPLPARLSPWRLVTPTLIVLGLGALGVCLSLFAVLLVRAQMVPVTVILAGDARQTHTRAARVADLLTEQKIDVGPYDGVYPALDSPISPNLVVRVEKARAVTLTVDGETRVIWTALANPADILAAAGLEASPDDRLLVDGTRTAADELPLWPVPASHITVRHAATLTVDDDGVQTTLQTTGDTVGDALFEAGVTLYLADAVAPGLAAPVEDGMAIRIARSRPVAIVADGKTVRTRTRGARVVDALADAGIALMGLDYTIPSEDAGVRPGIRVRVIRVRETTLVEEEPLPYETVYQADPERELDTEGVVQEGRAGAQRRFVRVRYENGVEIGREVDDTVVTRAPTNRIVAYGTRIVPRVIDTPDGPREYWRVLRLYATSYHPAALGGDNITATGRVLQKGIVGVDRDVIPFGAQVYVPGYGVGLAADTGPDRGNGMWIDLGYSDADYQPWHRYVDAYLLMPPPAQIDYRLPR